MRHVSILVVLLGATCLGHGFPGDQIRTPREEEAVNEISSEFAINKNNSTPLHRFMTLNVTDENFGKLIQLLVSLSEADCFREDGLHPRSRRGFWEDAVNKIKDTYHNVADKVKESATKVKQHFRKTFVDSGFKDKVKDFLENVMKDFNVENMCRNVQKLNNVLRRYPIDDKISTLMSFLDIILCQLSKDSDVGFKELMENPKYERLMSDKDSNTDFKKLMQYINSLDDTNNANIPSDLVTNSGTLATSKTTLMFILGSIIALNNGFSN